LAVDAKMVQLLDHGLVVVDDYDFIDGVMAPAS
jgi:hypothetical protein